MLLQFLAGQQPLINFVFVLVSLVICITIHEFSHAFVADRLGDPTARLAGRITLNPAAHLDPLGSVMILLFYFGWGKPVPINGNQIRQGRRGVAWVSLAGPASNFALALLLGLMFRFQLINTDYLIAELAWILIYINLGLGLFNLLPFGPLDGYKIATGFLPPKQAMTLAQLNQSGQGMFFMFIAIIFFQPFFESALRAFTWLVIGR